MKEEQILIALGWPLDEALSVCREKRKDGTLSEFIAEQWESRDPIPDPSEIYGRL